MRIKVIGKAHLKGTSQKTGNPYDFIQVHYNAPAKGVFGEGAMTLSLDPVLVPFDSIIVPHDYTVEFDQRGFPVSFTPVPGK